MQSNQTAVNYGLMAGLAAIAVALLLYLMNVKAYINYSDLLGWVVLTVGIVMGGLAVRNENDGFLPFKEALKATFLIWVISSFLVIVFKYALFNFIDPGLVDIQMELVMENIEKIGSLMGEEGMEAMMEPLSDPNNFKLTLSKALTGYAFGLIIPGIIIALIVSAIIKVNPPLDTEETMV
jgi:hypothetical protein